jgi:chromosome segregation ATPase
MSKMSLTAAFLCALPALCQTPAKEPDTLQALLAEVRQLRQDIEIMTAASQRIQIALYALQMQDAAVVRSSQRLDNQRDRCASQEFARQQTAAAIQKLEAALLDATVPQAQAQSIRERLDEMRPTLESQTAAAQSCRAREAEAASQLQKDQSTLDALRSQIDRLDRTLANAASGK